MLCSTLRTCFTAYPVVLSKAGTGINLILPRRFHQIFIKKAYKKKPSCQT
ncbi:hypothetical protein FTV88_1432 [Heliorestis convoluta]|uniref:Uncharacterized protein n=1 Tax=Heliorestis convoluta TaxID=356322 RepID=A0A5Q2N194_9FIRM|nr:hypothetical protein FTV88_1432 [Heliorestis convoluta]